MEMKIEAKYNKIYKKWKNRKKQKEMKTRNKDKNCKSKHKMREREPMHSHTRPAKPVKNTQKQHATKRVYMHRYVSDINGSAPEVPFKHGCSVLLFCSSDVTTARTKSRSTAPLFYLGQQEFWPGKFQGLFLVGLKTRKPSPPPP